MSDLKVYNASAGSGKTFLLTRQYIRLLIQYPERYRNILAVTFTNKATTEMKSRILEELQKMARGKTSEHTSFFLQTLKIPVNILQSNAKKALTNILHDFSHFHVSTIDTFFQSVFKAFTKELGVENTYSIELDTDNILLKAIDNLFEKLSNNSQLLSGLSEFAYQKIRDGKSWDFKKDIFDLGKVIFKEDFKAFDRTLIQKFDDKKFIRKLIKKLTSEIYSFEVRLKKYAADIMALYANIGLTQFDFSNKSLGVAGYIESVKKGNKNPPGVRTLKALSGIEGWLSKSSPKPAKEKITSIYPQLHEGLQRLVSFYESNISSYNTISAILKNMYILDILTDISREVKTYTTENDYVLLPDSMKLLNGLIANNDTPFIYEKIGNKFQHFLIDEFQDTSHTQWKNFLPLLKNALSQNYLALVVGDVKQSVYRWRNSDWKIMATQLNDDIKPWKIDNYILSYNWRSAKNIVEFNNRFFTGLLENLSFLQKKLSENKIGRQLLSDISRAYHTHTQKTVVRGDNDGFVHIRFIENGKKNHEEVLNILVENIEKLRSKHFKAKDIAVLVRNKKEGSMVAGFLAAYKNKPGNADFYNVVSNDSLLVKNAISIRIIDQALRFLATQDYIYERTLYELAKRYVDNSSEKDELFNDFIHSITALRKKTIFDVVNDGIIPIFHLNEMKNEYAYLQIFQDFVLNFVQKSQETSLLAFLEYWDEKRDDLYLQSSENQDAIQILTIHKAKGLEFDVVIIPFCNWQIDDTRHSDILWCKTENTDFSTLPIVPINYNQQLSNSAFMSAYYHEKIDRLMDSLNLLYVAMTRPKKALYVFTQISEKSKTPTIGKFIHHILTDKRSAYFIKKFHNDKRFWENGKLPTSPSQKTKGSQNIQSLTHYPIASFDKRLQLRLQVVDFYKQKEVEAITPVRKGILYHYLLQLIDSKKDIKTAIQRLYTEGHIYQEDISDYEDYLTDLLSIPKLNDWFGGTWKTMNERTILSLYNKKYRPDRIMIKNNKVVILDYKFGEDKKDAHKSQLRRYVNILKQFNNASIDAYLLYGTTRELIKI